ncbi:Exonuclease SbcC [Streptomyces misionensis JCM 4497]
MVYMTHGWGKVDRSSGEGRRGGGLDSPHVPTAGPQAARGPTLGRAARPALPQADQGPRLLGAGRRAARPGRGARAVPGQGRLGEGAPVHVRVLAGPARHARPGTR